ncbi:MAG: polysaccharide biosynthesis/export family protein [Bacteroidaceae bacterium]|nr:polysaccharide biosynthesis/export family protein [Bacteroidaceae bacterium]
MKKISGIVLLLIAVFFVSSCGNYKQVAYLQNIDSISLAGSKGLYDAKIMPKDLLTITVTTTDPKAAQPFNLSYNMNGGVTSSGGGVGSYIPYLVDNDGMINFPLVGRIRVIGLTKREAEQLVVSKIKPYLAADENPIVTIKMASFKVCVTGEVKSPGVFTVDQEKISIIEALTRAGDLTIQGKRQNILLIREQANGMKEHHRLNLNDAEIINSPYYYLQQNDIVYVEPNKIKARQATVDSSISYWLGLTSSVISLATLAITLLKK